MTGAALGDYADCSYSLDVQDLVLNGQVTAADTVTCVLANNTGGAIDLGGGTMRAQVLHPNYVEVALQRDGGAGFTDWAKARHIDTGHGSGDTYHVSSLMWLLEDYALRVTAKNNDGNGLTVKDVDSISAFSVMRVDTRFPQW